MAVRNKKLKTFIVLGTRPEAIKLAPVIREMRRRPWAQPVICVTGQHRQMVDQMLEVFNIKPDIDLKVMTRRQSLHSVTSKILVSIHHVLQGIQPHLVIVQGDTTTTFAASLAAFYMKIPVAHVEAGLRTRNRFEPFPEEMNRRLSDALAELHFAATVRNRQNLINEGVEPGRIYVVGNTVVDALKHILKFNRKRKEFPGLPDLREKKIITVTAHRRESFGEPLKNICAALQTISEMDGSIEIVYPVHLNPNVAGPVRKLLGGNKKIHLLPPLDYLTFVELLARSSLILTDSGGIQEEAPTMRKPVLLLRNVTERPEGVDAGFVRLVGTATNDIIAAVHEALNKKGALRSVPNPYGDGHSARRIASIIGEKRYQLISRQPAPVSQ